MIWKADQNASPPMFHELFQGRKRLALVRRIGAIPYVRLNGQRSYRHRYQLVTRFVGIEGVAFGPIFPSLAAAKREAERRA